MVIITYCRTDITTAEGITEQNIEEDPATAKISGIRVLSWTPPCIFLETT